MVDVKHTLKFALKIVIRHNITFFSFPAPPCSKFQKSRQKPLLGDCQWSVPISKKRSTQVKLATNNRQVDKALTCEEIVVDETYSLLTRQPSGDVADSHNNNNNILNQQAAIYANLFISSRESVV